MPHSPRGGRRAGCAHPFAPAHAARPVCMPGRADGLRLGGARSIFIVWPMVSRRSAPGRACGPTTHGVCKRIVWAPWRLFVLVFNMLSSRYGSSTRAANGGSYHARWTSQPAGRSAAVAASRAFGRQCKLCAQAFKASGLYSTGPRLNSSRRGFSSTTGRRVYTSRHGRPWPAQPGCG